MRACAEMNRAMLELRGVSYSTGEQNKDMTKSGQAWDMKYTWMLLLAPAERKPFTTYADLINIMTGIMPRVLLMWKRPEKLDRAS